MFIALGFPYSVMDNGDDLRVCVWIPRDLVDKFEDRKATALWIKEQIADLMVDYGHTVKVSETYCSEKLVAYRKIYIMNTAWMPSVYKRIIKIHGLSNAVCPFIDQIIGSVLSNAHSACATFTAQCPCEHLFPRQFPSAGISMGLL